MSWTPDGAIAKILVSGLVTLQYVGHEAVKSLWEGNQWHRGIVQITQTLYTESIPRLCGAFLGGISIFHKLSRLFCVFIIISLNTESLVTDTFHKLIFLHKLDFIIDNFGTFLDNLGTFFFCDLIQYNMIKTQNPSSKWANINPFDHHSSHV